MIENKPKLEQKVLDLLESLGEEKLEGMDIYLEMESEGT